MCPGGGSIVSRNKEPPDQSNHWMEWTGKKGVSEQSRNDGGSTTSRTQRVFAFMGGGAWEERRGG